LLQKVALSFDVDEFDDEVEEDEELSGSNELEEPAVGMTSCVLAAESAGDDCYTRAYRAPWRVRSSASHYKDASILLA